MTNKKFVRLQTFSLLSVLPSTTAKKSQRKKNVIPTLGWGKHSTREKTIDVS
jgi:hypothetical protein